MIDPALAAKLAKLLRLLASDKDGEVLAAASRIAAIAVANDVDWDQVLSQATVDLSREQMERLYNAGYQRGLEEGAQKSRVDDWANAGIARTGEVGARYDEVMALLSAASQAATARKLNRFEIDFTISMVERLHDWRQRAFVSARQWEVLDRLRNKLRREGYAV